MNLTELLFPRSCIFCKKSGLNICLECRSIKFVPYKSEVCHVCKIPVLSEKVHENCQSQTNLDRVVVCFHYNNSAKVVIEQLKYHFYYSIASEMAEMMKPFLAKSKITPEIAIPVPLHWFKKNYRGFNQAELLAQHVLGKNFTQDLIQRSKNTKTQVGMKRKERMANLKDVFRLKKPLQCNYVVLVDDVVTTGTTLEECAKVLKVAKVEKVFGLVFAGD